MILEPREYRLLDGLRLHPCKSFAGRVRGERLTKKKGISIEFADFREYSEGDDLRHLDWNVLARLDTAVIRTYQDEEDLALYLLVDGSPSMEFGDPSKQDQAKKLASAIGYVALSGGDTVLPTNLGYIAPASQPLRSFASYPRLDRWLSDKRRETRPETLSKALRRFANSVARPGIVAILSDGLDQEISAVLRVLGGRGHEVWFVQILSDVEIDPDLEGDLRLIDGECGQTVEITANSLVIKEYRRRLHEHNLGITEAVRRIGGRYCLIRADKPAEHFIRSSLRREGWIA